jgi:autoinducer 2-degrading protein
MRVGVIANLQIKPGMNAGFEAAFRRFQQTVRKSEPGVIYFGLHRSRTDTNSYSVMEQYRDQQGLNEHRKTPHYLAIPATFSEFMAGPPDIREFDAVD